MGHGRGTHVVSNHIKYGCKCGISKQFVTEKQLLSFKKLHGKYCESANTRDTRISELIYNASKAKVLSEHTLGEKN